MPNKPKKNQPETPNIIQERDVFLTPFYATDLIVPFIPENVKTIWECCCGDKKMISRRLQHWGYKVVSTDLLFGHNFLTMKPDFEFDMILTNTPFSIKSKIYQKCREYETPFGLLLPADYSGWICKAILQGAEKVVPNSRINYITPNIIDVVWRGQTKLFIEKETRKKFTSFKKIPKKLLSEHLDSVQRYKNLESIPNPVIAKWSASQFHSMWITEKFNIGKSETIVQLTKEMKLNIQ